MLIGWKDVCVDELQYYLCKNEQEKEFTRFTKSCHDEQNEFMEHGYAQIFAQNVQLRNCLNSTNLMSKQEIWIQ